MKKIFLFFLLVTIVQPLYAQINNDFLYDSEIDTLLRRDTLLKFPEPSTNTIYIYKNEVRIASINTNLSFKKLNSISKYEGINNIRKELLFYENGRIWVSSEIVNYKYNGLTEIYSKRGKLNAIYQYRDNIITDIIYSRRINDKNVKKDYVPFILYTKK